MRSIGAVLSPAPAPPVRRGSHRRGRCERTVWRPTSREELGRLCLAARRFDLLGRRPGQRNGPLGHVALELLELLGNLVCRRTGRLEPSILWLMRKLRRSKDAVVRALAALKEHGFVDWLRRWEPIEGAEGPGPRVRQVSNAYRLLPPAPGAGCVIRGVEGRAEELAALKADLSLAELPHFLAEDATLAHVLGELGARVQARAERESAGRSENPLEK